MVAMQMGDKEASIKNLKKAIAEDENYCDAILLYGDLQNRNGDIESAIKLYNQAIQIDSNYCYKRYKTIAEI
ncbi:MAG: hypothetical protein RI955_907, partial [Bacteroidota bacterium]